MAVLRNVETACLAGGGNCGQGNRSGKQCKKGKNSYASLNHGTYLDTKSAKGL
jgi:hypothetical protein